MIVVQIILIFGYFWIFYQDYKERQVFWFLFPLVALLSGILLFDRMFVVAAITTICINLVLTCILIYVIYLYSKYKMKMTLNQTFSIGDALMLVALAFTFESEIFMVLLVFGLIFSLLLHLALKRFSKFSNVPLAGYLSLFFAASYIVIWFDNMYWISS